MAAPVAGLALGAQLTGFYQVAASPEADREGAVASFVDRYNTSWLIQRHGHRTPKEAYQAAQSA